MRNAVVLILCFAIWLIATWTLTMYDFGRIHMFPFVLPIIILGTFAGLFLLSEFMTFLNKPVERWIIKPFKKILE